MTGYTEKRQDRRICNVIQVVLLDVLLTAAVGSTLILVGVKVLTACLLAFVAGCILTLCVCFGIALLDEYQTGTTDLA